MRESADIVVLGGGIVGLAVAYRYLLRHPGHRLVLLEKEDAVGKHQTGHNSGVLHSGIYYKPGSLKSETCRAGKALMEGFCQEHSIPFERTGKVIVATEESELSALENIHERGKASGVLCERIGPERLAELEPHTAGIAALHVPEAGIVDYLQVCQVLAKQIEKLGGSVHTQNAVRSLIHGASEVTVKTKRGEWSAKRAINCTGLHSDRLLAKSGAKREARIVPFRGEYYELTPKAQHLCRTLIYPVPDPQFPFLGVHFTRMIQGGVECGPNAVLALAREGYRWRNISPRDLWDTLSYGGFWRLAGKHWKTGMGEVWRSVSKAAFVKALSKLIPEIQQEHLVRAPAGVRAQALGPDGSMIDDFKIQPQGALLHVLNAPSPAATSSLAIGDAIIDRL